MGEWLGDLRHGVAEAAKLWGLRGFIARAPDVPALGVFLMAERAHGAVGGVPCGGVLVLARRRTARADIGADMLDG